MVRKDYFRKNSKVVALRFPVGFCTYIYDASQKRMWKPFFQLTTSQVRRYQTTTYLNYWFQGAPSYKKINLVLEGFKTSLIISLEGLRENCKSELVRVGTEFVQRLLRSAADIPAITYKTWFP